ncbi:hypothetical protein JOD31_003247 [Methylopila capsulata]|uniref:SPOR domain-containing protein n=1 Tax=Methylopila capsulata TaxID=61654 RepID=A0A9W6MTV7_9HYPH|nr:SPOR domain-containing protein [Methylopila capsulata]MBM7852996.1 hypothetical protein [Methylopila capsulata]GLK57793.1 hypothetical protein GCM10008170_38130 [Methylopila capsulata]
MHYDQDYDARRLDRPTPAVVWGLLMIAALGGAGAVMIVAPSGSSPTRLIAAGNPESVGRLDREVKRLTDERAALAERLARLERGVGEMKLAAARAALMPETTGSVARPTPAAGHPPAFAIGLGPETSLEAVRRRWSALSGRYPELARLTPRAVRSGPGRNVVDLVAGPFPTAAEAVRACGDLAAEGVPCDTTPYDGEPLDRS